MNKSWLLCCIVLGMFLLSGIDIETALAQNVSVTFQVNMSIKMREGTFLPGSGDIVRLAGSINDWGNSTDTLKDGNSDSIYTKTVSVAPSTDIAYKFLKTLRGSDWESMADNRHYIVPVGGGTVSVAWFDNDSVFTPAANVNVTFQVNMKVKMLEGTFLPGSGDIVRLAGSINDWGNSTDTLKDGNSDSIYTKTVTVLENTAVQYKFLKTPRGGLDWETMADNRGYTVPLGGGTVPVAYFDNDSVANTPVNANVLWHADYTPYLQLGWFSPALHDSAQIRGGMNGWGGTIMQFNPLSNGTYEVTLPYSGTSGDQIGHKYFMQMDSVSAESRFPGYGTDQDGVRYEHPAQRGDGNRIIDVLSSGNLTTPFYWFGDINPKGLLLNNTDSVTVTMKVNMGPATRDPIPFNPATDTVRLQFLDRMWKFAQAKRQGGTAASFPDRIMTRQGPTDSIYTVTFLVLGKAHYHILYNYRFTGSFASEEGAGLGAQGGRRSRYIQPLAPNSFPRNYTAPTDTWKHDAPLPAEVAPFSPLAAVQDNQEPGIPVGYKLGQNYPNPFNPSTRIKYTIPERANVRLIVYNLLGQQVATLVNEDQPVGNYVALFEANSLSTGVYFYRLEAGKFTETRKMLLVK